MPKGKRATIVDLPEHMTLGDTFTTVTSSQVRGEIVGAEGIEPPTTSL
jgi:hypothetical protein